MTNILLFQFTALLAAHWFADFAAQTHWQASNKSHNPVALFMHIASYGFIFALFAIFIFARPGNGYELAGFIFANIILHWVTDFFTSRWSARHWGDWHKFFVIIGLDQLIHQVTIAFTVIYFFGEWK